MTGRGVVGGHVTVLLDLDGTICLLFAHTDLDPLRRRVATLLRAHGLEDLADGDVFTTPTRVAAARRGSRLRSGSWSRPATEPDTLRTDPLLSGIDALLTEVELRAADTAPLVAGAEEVITGWVDADRPLAVVTNNSPACVGRLARRCLPALAEVPVIGRDPRRTERAKPDPRGIHLALSLLGRDAPVDASSAVMVGDSLSDLAAARAAGCRFVGMGPTAAKRSRLRGAPGETGAGPVVDFHALRDRLG